MTGEAETLSAKVGWRDEVLSGWFNNTTGTLAPHFAVDSDDIVVDVGCGGGGHASFCARRGARVILCDADPERITAAEARFAALPGARFESHVTDSNPLPLADATATRIMCIEVLEHVDEPSLVLREMARVGKPNALYLITVPGTAQEILQKSLAHPSYFQKPNHIRIFAPGELAALVQDAGLIVEHCGGIGFFWSLWMAFWWQCNVPLSNAHHPTLDAWAQTWNLVLDGRDGMRIKAALDELLPKSQIIVARKPA